MSPDDVRRILGPPRTVAVLGASANPERPAHYVPAYLARHGHRILPVNPAYVGQELFGEPVVGTLGEVGAPVDVVDVFRRPDQIPGHVPELLAMVPRPAVVWFQLGIRHDPSAAMLREAGIEVVQDACTLAEHRRHVAGR